jgi:mRNA interferase RelE/StbE
MRIRIKPSAVKELERILRIEDRRRIVARIEGLSEVPRPEGFVKLTGRGRYRLRQGPWRIVYAVDDAEKVVLVVKIGHRRDVHR